MLSVFSPCTRHLASYRQAFNHGFWVTGYNGFAHATHTIYMALHSAGKADNLLTRKCVVFFPNNTTQEVTSEERVSVGVEQMREKEKDSE